jgi:hypothetical protein
MGKKKGARLLEELPVALGVRVQVDDQLLP